MGQIGWGGSSTGPTLFFWCSRGVSVSVRATAGRLLLWWGGGVRCFIGINLSSSSLFRHSCRSYGLESHAHQATRISKLSAAQSCSGVWLGSRRRSHVGRRALGDRRTRRVFTPIDCNTVSSHPAACTHACQTRAEGVCTHRKTNGWVWLSCYTSVRWCGVLASHPSVPARARACNLHGDPARAARLLSDLRLSFRSKAIFLSCEASGRLWPWQVNPV